MILDATVAPADIHYPTDLNLVNGIAKRRDGQNRIMAYLAVTGLTEAAMQILVMNVAHLLRFLLCLFLQTQARWIRREEIPLAVGFSV